MRFSGRSVGSAAQDGDVGGFAGSAVPSSSFSVSSSGTLSECRRGAGRGGARGRLGSSFITSTEEASVSVPIRWSGTMALEEEREGLLKRIRLEG